MAQHKIKAFQSDSGTQAGDELTEKFENWLAERDEAGIAIDVAEANISSNQYRAFMVIRYTECGFKQ